MSPPTAELPDLREPWTERMKRVLLGRKRELHPSVFHKVSLIALLAWVGLGADGLSSSAYGPEGSGCCPPNCSSSLRRSGS